MDYEEFRSGGSALTSGGQIDKGEIPLRLKLSASNLNVNGIQAKAPGIGRYRGGGINEEIVSPLELTPDCSSRPVLLLRLNIKVAYILHNLHTACTKRVQTCTF